MQDTTGKKYSKSTVMTPEWHHLCGCDIYNLWQEKRSPRMKAKNCRKTHLKIIFIAQKVAKI